VVVVVVVVVVVRVSVRTEFLFATNAKAVGTIHAACESKIRRRSKILLTILSW